MLTSDLILARRKDGELRLRALDAKGRAEALVLASRYLDVAHASVGCIREDLDAAWAEVTASATQPKLSLGLRKLVEDACGFEADLSVEPAVLRRALFTRASLARRTRCEGEVWSREEIVSEVAATLGVLPEELLRGLFSDLRAEHVLRAAPSLDAESVVLAWELGQAQAVLLTAVRVTIDVRAASPGALRAFFAKLKFHQLLFASERTEEGYRVVLDGPLSMFGAVTKYGLRLALVVPALRALERWSLVADIRWGKERAPLSFRMASADLPRSPDAATDLHVSDEVRALATGIDAQKGWRAKATTAILDVPGLGVCIPDLELVRADGAKVYVEVLGYWSRDAVWRRVELATQGLSAKIVFAVSARLRVSADVLGAEVPAALYVYKRTMSAKALLEHAERVLG